MAVISDNLVPVDIDGDMILDANMADLVSSQDYEPFGSLLPGRNYGSSSYRFGFNGKENDNDVHGATGTFQDYGMRAYDTRVGRFFSVDPIAKSYPELTPYQFASNTPIGAIDLDGLEAFKNTSIDNKSGKTVITLTIDLKVKNSSETASASAVAGWAAKIAAKVEKTYSATDGAISYVTKVNLVMNTEGTGFAEVNPETDFYLDFVDEVEGTDEERIAGMSTVGATSTNRIQVRWQSLNSPGVNRSDIAIARTGTHELGHALGLHHPWSSLNTASDVDQGPGPDYLPSEGVLPSTIKSNIMNSDGNRNEKLKSTSGTLSTPNQRSVIRETVPEK